MLRLKSIRFHAGPRPNDAGLEVNAGSVVVLVGPNGSGKSAALREIETWCRGADSPRRVVAEVDVQIPDTENDVVDLLQEISVPPPTDRPVIEGAFYVGGFQSGPNPTISVATVERRLLPEIIGGRMDLARHYLIQHFTLRLDGRTRFGLADPREWRDFLAAPTNHLVKLFQQDELREEVRRLTAEAFGSYFVIDPTQQGTLRIRMSAQPPGSKTEEQSFDERARTFHSAAPLVTDLSDGAQAFVGLVSAVIALPHRIMLIDEPEAFLHPPLARRLGATLVNIAEKRGASLIVATHSAEFLRGCVEQATAPTVVRLTFDRGVATARALATADLRRLLRVPLLRSTGALSAAFHRAAVVSEADADRAFYEEVNRRLLDSGAGRGVPEAVFLNAQNKQTLGHIVGPLRKLGVPAVAIPDADYLSDTGTVWSNLLDACGVPAAQQTRLADLRDQVCLALGGREAAQQTLPTEGVTKLTGPAADSARMLLTGLETYGIFVVPGGGVESWLMALDITGKATWLARIFERMGDVSAANYVYPADDDVWAFLDRIAIWANNPVRAGT